LSYTWGDKDNKKQITVNGLSFTVSESADAALRRLRPPKKSKTLWINAICINQLNMEEKAVQRSLTTQIYESASRVCGFAPWNAQQGDLVCVLKGGKTPYVLRLPPAGSVYQLVGEAYVHGIMAGEAMDIVKGVQTFGMV
jgi:hypothetical protein